MSFREAASSFLNARTAPTIHGRVKYIGKNTLKDYKKKSGRLNVFFGDMPLNEIHLGNFVKYQEARAEGKGFTRMLGKQVIQSPAGSAKINSELGLLLRIMKSAFASVPKPTPWDQVHMPPDPAMVTFATNLLTIENHYLRFQVEENDIPRALSQEEQDHFLRVAASRPEWHPVWWYSLAALDLTFSSDEMRTIRIGDVNLAYQIIGVNRRYGKNKYRRREVPICDGAALWALERLIERQGKLCGVKPQPHHFLLPGRLVRNVFDPETHMSETGLRKPFEAVREKADLPWFQINGWRHTAITRLAEAGVPIATIMERAGHTTPKMTAHYTHISLQAQRMAITGAGQRKPVMTAQAYQLRQQVAGY